MKMKLENPIKYAEELSKGKVKCSCGHSVIMPPHYDKIICNWCGNYAFRNKKAEFEYRMQEKLRRSNGN